MRLIFNKTFLLVFVLSMAFILPVFAKGDVDIYLRNNSDSVAIKKALGNYKYAGTAQRYTFKETASYGTGEYYDNGGDHSYEYTVELPHFDGYVDVAYRDVKPYVLRDDVFKANANYYRAGMSGSGTDGWWIFADSDSAEYPPYQYHQYATKTTSKNSAVTGAYYGQIKMTYKRADGTTGQKVVNVQIQNRECEAYNSGKWREVSTGRWEER
jgi:hypothetical protein